jgi:hypothetical protein
MGMWSLPSQQDKKLRNNARYCGYTLTLYRDVLECVNGIVLEKWANIANLPLDKARIILIKKLIHCPGEGTGEGECPWCTRLSQS